MIVRGIQLGRSGGRVPMQSTDPGMSDMLTKMEATCTEALHHLEHSEGVGKQQPPGLGHVGLPSIWLEQSAGVRGGQRAGRGGRRAFKPGLIGGRLDSEHPAPGSPKMFRPWL